MEIRENEELKTQINNWYEDYKLSQTIFTFEDTAETIQLIAKDKDGNIIHDETFMMAFLNCHINLTFQDKGVQSEEPLYETIQVRKTP